MNHFLIVLQVWGVGMERGGRKGEIVAKKKIVLNLHIFPFFSLLFPTFPHTDIVRLTKQDTKKLQICPHFSSFSFSNWDKDQDERGREEEEEEGEGEKDIAETFGAPQDEEEDGGFFGGEMGDMGGDDSEGETGDMGGDMGWGGDEGMGGGEEGGWVGGEEGGEGEGGERMMASARVGGQRVLFLLLFFLLCLIHLLSPHHPQKQGPPLMMMSTKKIKLSEMLNNFDTLSLRNWAGPQHWKFPAPVAPPPSSSTSTTSSSGLYFPPLFFLFLFLFVSFFIHFLFV